MNQIFAFFALLSNIGLAVTFYLGWNITDPNSLAEPVRQQVSLHMLFALASISFTLLVHAIVLTYFMGTGRWIEETSAAYRFEPNARAENIRLKYKVIPGMMLCMLLLILTGAFGAIADPASNATMQNSPTIHLALAAATLLSNILVSFIEHFQIGRNSKVVEAVYAEVLRVRKERGLDQEPATKPE